MPTPTIPTISDIERITEQPDPVLRNLQITQCYHELALVLAERTRKSANWCAFATWASKQAGQTIRKEDLRRSLENELDSDAALKHAAQELSSAARRMRAMLGSQEAIRIAWQALDPETALTRSSQAVARGNLKVFAEIGREFARFYATCLSDTSFNQDTIERFCEGLRPGEPPDGQRYLRQAFQHYYQAVFEEDDKQRSELLLLANLEIGFHEQTRLQPEINEALAAPVISPEEFASNLLRALRPNWRILNDILLYFLRLLGWLVDFDEAARTYTRGAQRQVQHIVTETMMTIEIPVHRRLRLGEDLPDPFPAILLQVANPELHDLLAQIDPTPDSTRESGTQYWGDLADRLHFIADMFRCYQTDESLFEAPFSAEQTSSLKVGLLPDGPL